jgi:hypothetical protein
MSHLVRRRAARANKLCASLYAALYARSVVTLGVPHAQKSLHATLVYISHTVSEAFVPNLVHRTLRIGCVPHKMHQKLREVSVCPVRQSPLVEPYGASIN